MKRHRYYPATSGRSEWICWQMEDGMFFMAHPIFHSYGNGGTIVYNIIGRDPTFLFPRGIPKDFGHPLEKSQKKSWSFWIEKQGRFKFPDHWDWIEFVTNPEVMRMVAINE